MIVDGKKIAAEILTRLGARVKERLTPPVLGVALVGDDPRSVIYVNQKKAAAERLGIEFKIFRFPAEIKEADLETAIKEIQTDSALNGLIVQLPLPADLESHKIINVVDPRIDIDCLTQANLDRLKAGQALFLPPTVAAILEILNYHQIDLKNKKIVVVGAGQLVGAPMALWLEQAGLDFTVCLDSEVASREKIKTADVIITGVGQPKIITAGLVKPGAVVIDAGVSLVDGQTVGDVDFDTTKKKASLITPPIGGVGPVTVAKLLNNLVKD